MNQSNLRKTEISDLIWKDLHFTKAPHQFLTAIRKRALRRSGFTNFSEVTQYVAVRGSMTAFEMSQGNVGSTLCIAEDSDT